MEVEQRDSLVELVRKEVQKQQAAKWPKLLLTEYTTAEAEELLSLVGPAVMEACAVACEDASTLGDLYAERIRRLQRILVDG